MKKSKVFSMLVASAVVTSALAAGTAGAAADKKPAKPAATKQTAAKFKVINSGLTVDGENAVLRAIEVNGTKLYSVRDLADALGAGLKLDNGSVVLNDLYGYHNVTIKPNIKSLQVDGASQEFTVAPKLQDGNIYVELGPTLDALGAESVSGGGVYKMKRLEGSFTAPIFDEQSNLLVTKEDGEVPQVFKINTSLGTPSQVFNSNEGAANAVVSPDHKLGAFTDENGQLFVYDLGTGHVNPVGSDTSVKTDLTWSADGKKLYFIQGDKQEKISYITLDSGKITEVLADKVENKSDLQVTNDDKKIAYFVNVTGVAKNDADSTEDSLTIDYTGAGAQLYSLDLVTKGAKPVQLTKGTDNKLLPSFLSDGSLVYISADPDGKDVNSVLKSISADGSKTTDLVADIDVNFDLVTKEGKLLVAGIKADGSSQLFEVANGAKTELYSSPEGITEVAVSKDGKIAVISGGKVVMVQGGKGTELTK
ncbi:stalk domain-containing protein [Paenibacillus tuaregi]|uniref:stalk domain-containing protein n=1 Tax=Paenibacillus tuaregi TaxID=1816681 RepID=UPI000838154D|nr:stalk domain-containing protein [Paenibacillus tuaregi]